jgi:hypothetical protein
VDEARNYNNNAPETHHISFQQETEIIYLLEFKQLLNFEFHALNE